MNVRIADTFTDSLAKLTGEGREEIMSQGGYTFRMPMVHVPNAAARVIISRLERALFV